MTKFAKDLCKHITAAIQDATVTAWQDKHSGESSPCIPTTVTLAACKELFGNIFRNNQLVKCSKCDGTSVCEECTWEDAEETILSADSYCYYPYGLGM